MSMRAHVYENMNGWRDLKHSKKHNSEDDVKGKKPVSSKSQSQGIVKQTAGMGDAQHSVRRSWGVEGRERTKKMHTRVG